MIERPSHKTINGVEHKRCSVCKKWFPATLEYFYKSNTGWDKLMYVCKECNLKKSAEHIKKHYDKHLEKARKYQRDLRLGKKKRGKEPKFLKKRVAIDGLVYKQCSVCKKWLPVNTTNFENCKTASDGVSSACKECRAMQKRRNRYRKIFMECYIAGKENLWKKLKSNKHFTYPLKIEIDHKLTYVTFPYSLKILHMPRKQKTTLICNLFFPNAVKIEGYKNTSYYYVPLSDVEKLVSFLQIKHKEEPAKRWGQHVES